MSDKYTESFDDWQCNNCGKNNHKHNESCWKCSNINPLFNRINELLERLRECEETLKFYAYKGHWQRSSRSKYVDSRCAIARSDREYFIVDLKLPDTFGGKRAREYFKKYNDTP